MAPAPPDRRFYVFVAVLSAAVLGFLAYLLVLRRGSPAGGPDLRFLPAVNAGLNAVAATLLTGGWIAVRRGRRRVHQFLMVGAFAASILFFLSYSAYHYVHGDTRYAGTGPLRVLYLAVLATHVLLSIPLVPMALLALAFAYRQAFDRHRRLTRVLTPVWLYVSVTGVAIYFMLRGSLPSAP